MSDEFTIDQLQGVVDKAVQKIVSSEKDVTAEQDPPLERSGSVLRDRKFEIRDDQKGIAAARFVRALAFGRGDAERAKHFATKAFDDPLGDEIKKALVSSELTAGGALVLPEYAAEVIELLRSQTIVRRAGPRVLPMNEGSLTIRKQTAPSTASYVGESQDIPTSEPEVGQIDLVAKKLAAIVPISNDLLAFTSGPSADEFVRDDMVMVISRREDRAFLRDDGTEHTPKGIRWWAADDNLLSSNGTTADDIEADFKDLLNALEGNDVRLIRPVWFMHTSRKNHLRNLRDANGNLIYPEMRSPTPTMYGWPVLTSTAIPANLGGSGNESEIYLVDMVDALIAESTALEIVVDSSASYMENGTLQSAFSRDETAIRAIMRHDFAMRHRESAAVITDVAWGAQ